MTGLEPLPTSFWMRSTGGFSVPRHSSLEQRRNRRLADSWRCEPENTSDGRRLENHLRAAQAIPWALAALPGCQALSDDALPPW